MFSIFSVRNPFSLPSGAVLVYKNPQQAADKNKLVQHVFGLLRYVTQKKSKLQKK